MIPIIDVSALIREDVPREEKLAIADAIGKACAEVGFFVIVGHGIDDSIVQSVWTATKTFFDLPEDQKQSLIFPQAEYPFGYSSLGSELLSSGKAVEKSGSTISSTIDGSAPDIKEMFSIGPASPEAGFPTRKFPIMPKEFQQSWELYYERLNSLAMHILKAFAMALFLGDDNWFEKFTDHHASALRAINYPAIASTQTVLPGQLRASAHTDYGTITILKSDGPGLQVSKDLDPPVWHDVPHVPDGFVINIGDLMKRWTNDRWLSTLHRVVIPSDDVFIPGDAAADAYLCRRRQSLAFFHNLNRDAVVEVIVQGEDEQPKYAPIVAGDFLLQKHLASMGAK